METTAGRLLPHRIASFEDCLVMWSGWFGARERDFRGYSSACENVF